MLRLKGGALGGGNVRGHINLAQLAEKQGTSRTRGGMMVMSGSNDHLSGSVLVFAGTPTQGELSAAVGGEGHPKAGAIICERSSPELQRSVTSLNLAGVSDIQTDYFWEGDNVSLNGTDGTVEIDGVNAREVVACMVQCAGKTLLLRRSQAVGSWQGKWAAVSGYIEEGEEPMDTAFKEVREELSVEKPTLIRKGMPVVTRKEGVVWISHPFLFELDKADIAIRIDWEHTDFKWITLDQLQSFDTVPGLSRTISALGLGRV